jgi:hypothetical protein
VPRPVTEPKLNKRERKGLARRLRALLARGPIDMPGIVETLEEEPEAIVVGLRTLRTREGTVRSGIRFGHVIWWWEPERATRPASNRIRT